MTPWVKRLLIANVAVFLLQLAYPMLTGYLQLVPATALRTPWTPFTYMFAHGGFAHIGFNMLALWIFGPRLEARLGGNRFIALYLVSGLTGALLSIFTPYAAIIGASGAVFGIMAAYARYWPREKFLVYGVLPVEARWLVIAFVLMALFGARGVGDSGTAHFAHLGGFVGAAIFLYVMEHSRARVSTGKSGAVRAEVQQPAAPRGDDMKRWATIPRSELHEINRSEVDRLLDKISLKGINSLTPAERAALDRFSKQKS
ncbi:MAG: rhomboid family intramembrane serine protease [Gemmatimonadota bacterium]